MKLFLMDENISAPGLRATIVGKAVYARKMGAKTPGEVVWTDGMEMLVSARVLKALAGFTGFETTAVKLRQDGGDLRYHFLVVTGRCGAYLPEKTVRLRKKRGAAWNLYQGLCFAPPRPAQDFCQPTADLRFVFVSDRVRAALQGLNCANVSLTRCEEVLLQPSTYELICEKGSVGG